MTYHRPDGGPGGWERGPGAGFLTVAILLAAVAGGLIYSPFLYLLALLAAIVWFA